MWWDRLMQRALGLSRTGRRTRSLASPGRLRLVLEHLEDRTLPASYTAASVSDLIHDIRAANHDKAPSTVTLVAGTDFLLGAVNNKTDGPTGLPVIKGNLTIIGNGDIIERSTASGTPAFRLFDVASGASLTLQNMTLHGGLAFGSGVSAQGGAIYTQGTLVLDSVSVNFNVA